LTQRFSGRGSGISRICSLDVGKYEEPFLDLSNGDPGSPDELDDKVQRAQEQLLHLKRQQETIERQKRDLEELSRKQDELEKGRSEMVEKLSRSLS